jgi:hypothetical protein
MAVTVVGSVYNIPELDALVLFNEKTGSTWDANSSKITAVESVLDADGNVTAIKVTVLAG